MPSRPRTRLSEVAVLTRRDASRRPVVGREARKSPRRDASHGSIVARSRPGPEGHARHDASAENADALQGEDDPGEHEEKPGADEHDPPHDAAFGFRCLAVTCSDLPDHGQAISRGLPPAGQGGWTCGTAHGRTSADTYRTVGWFSLWSAIRTNQVRRTRADVPARRGPARAEQTSLSLSNCNLLYTAKCARFGR